MYIRAHEYAGICAVLVSSPWDLYSQEQSVKLGKGCGSGKSWGRKYEYDPNMLYDTLKELKQNSKALQIHLDYCSEGKTPYCKGN